MVESFRLGVRGGIEKAAELGLDGVQGDGPREHVTLRLGEGDVDFPRYVATLDEVGYDGFLTIERTVRYLRSL